MLAQLLLAFDLPWQVVATPVIGLASAGLTLYVGRMLIRPYLVTNSVPSAPPEEKQDQKFDPFVHGSANEKRVAHRRSGNPVQILISDAEATRTPELGWVLDRSVGGLCLSVNAEVKPGSILSLRACHAPESIAWSQIEVRTCRQEGSAWELGCQFVRTPSWNVLLLFG
jgi:hypothetical protein